MDKFTLRNAYERGQTARISGHYRVTPFYREMRYVDGRTLDVTNILDRYWYAGFDQLPFPKEELIP